MIRIHNKDEAYVFVECEDGEAYELREYFTFFSPNYQFTPQFRAKVWDGKIRLFDIRTHLILRGLVPEIVKFCEARDYEWEYDNEVYDEEFSLIEANQFISKLRPTHEPRDYQLDAFVHSVRSRRALLLSATSSGKSLITYLLSHYLLSQGFVKGLVIVPTINLVEQLSSDFKDYSTNNKWDVDAFVHKIYGGQEKITNKAITVSTWQSLFPLPKKYFHQFDFVVGDEAHLFKAKEIMGIMTNLINTKYRIGMTGTLDGSKTHKLVLEGVFGPVRKIISAAELMEQGHAADLQIKCILLKHTDSLCQAAKNFTYQQEIEYLVLNEARNRFITNLAASLEKNTLVLYQYVDKHGKILHDLINTKLAGSGRRVFFVAGETDVKVREYIRAIVEKEKDAIIVASFGTYSTGINIKNLHNIIFASPSKARIKILQSIGRGLRQNEGKEEATLFDIADDMRHKRRENYTLKHFAERIKIYTEEQFKFKVYKVELKG
jgi:superfamily II DNA or RNA helicase